ncbi:unnamed protein product [Cochlearia groenlandica]
MDDFNHGGSSTSSLLPPFLTKTYDMVNDSSSDWIVSWSRSNRSFVVWNQTEFCRDLLPRFFKHNNFSSFVRQLNTYGFRKADPEQWEFANDDFVRDQPHLMKNIRRRKPVHSHSLPNLQAQQNPLTDSERTRMNNQIKRLRKEKEGLLEKLHKQVEEKELFATQVKQLKEQLQHMEKRQRTTVSFPSNALDKPELALNLSPCIPEKNDRKRRLHSIGFEANQPCIVVDREKGSTSLSSHTTENQVERLAIWENLESDSCETIVQSRNMMNIDVDESSTTCPESPPLACIHLSIETRLKTLPSSPRIIDMNSNPDVSKEQNIVSHAPSLAGGGNDVFWQQFFTENPGSTTEHQQEVESEKKDDKAENRSEKCWWISRNVNTITEQLGHLTS